MKQSNKFSFLQQKRRKYSKILILKQMQNLPNSIFGCIQDFLINEQCKPLGSGSFGVVKRGIHKMTGKIYAIKIIQCNQGMTQNDILLLSRQISIHYKLHHPHIIKLWAVLQKSSKIYMVMDYAQNGNLFQYLGKKKFYSETESFRIFYQLFQAIQYMHKLDVFHRDIKPENILLDHDFNIKLCDFGWVAEEINKKRNTFCGTYEYMAPEMVRDIPYNYKVDIWALGIFLYELTHGVAPFPADSIEAIKQKFEDGTYEVKQSLSPQFKTLIRGLLQFEPKKRLELKNIRECEWVQKFSKKGQEGTKRFQNTKTQILEMTNSQQTQVEKIHEKGKIEKQKFSRKKYRTLEEQKFIYFTQNMKKSKHNLNQKQSEVSNKSNHKESKLKQNLGGGSVNKDRVMISPLKLGGNIPVLTPKISNKKSMNSQQSIGHHLKQSANLQNYLSYSKKTDKGRYQKQDKRKKKASTKSIIRNGTEGSELSENKQNKFAFQDKMVYHNDEKKKNRTKRT